MFDLLFEKVAYMDETGTLCRERYVGVTGDRIRYLGTDKPPEAARRTIDGSHRLLLPGFVNTHCHVPMTLLRGYGEGLRLQDWLYTRIFPFEGKLTGDDVYYASLLGIAEMLRSGVSSFTDMYFECDRIIEACTESGIKANIAWGISGQDPSFEANSRYGIVERWMTPYRDPTGRVRTEQSVHAEYTCSEALVRDVAAYAKAHGARMQVHLAETKTEQAECIERHGVTPARFFLDCGVFEVPTTAAHCVWVTPEDIGILADHGVTMAHCPTSNLKLASGIAPAWAMHQAGVNVSIGTDGASSNNNLNMLEEIALAALLQKAKTGDPTVMHPAEVLRMASRNGAISQGREDCGQIAEGCKADLILFDLSAPHLQPEDEMLAHVVHAASAEDICMNVIDGQVVCENGVPCHIDLERVIFEVNARKRRILSEL